MNRKSLKRKSINIDNKYAKIFLENVDVGNENDCWNWLGYINISGYGTFVYYDENKTQLSIQPSHLMYKLYYSYYDYIRKIYYRCGNKLCCNPLHLSINKRDKKFIIDEKTLNRFWRKAIIKDKDSCWEWIGAKNRKGYGTIYFDGKVRKAHRVSYVLTYGDILGDLCVLHKCDNPSCVNPNHLFIGTVKDNSDDMILKERDYHPEGELQPISKLKEKDVYEIIELIKNNYSYPYIGKLYDVSPNTINAIANGFTWKYIKRPLFFRRKKFKIKKENLVDE
jgi:hypothetical protein